MCKKLIYPTVLLLTLAATAAQAADPTWIRAFYYDSRYGTAWQGNSAATRDALTTAGYAVLNANELKTWMDARIADRKLSVVVFCQDAAPDTVAETMTSSCTLRKYLDAGGKIVWYSDIPFYYVSNASAVRTTWGDAGATNVLGFATAGAPRDTYNVVTITPLGKTWGLTQTWQSRRPALPTVTPNLDVLATDNAGNAAGWVKHYVPNDTFRGFVRIFDQAGQANVEDIMRVAEYIGLKASSPNPANGAVGVMTPLLQWSPGSFAVFHKVYFGTTPDLTEADVVAAQQPFAMYFHVPGLQPGVTYYWRVDEIEADMVTVRTGDVWSFTAEPLTAYVPKPTDGAANVFPGPTLSWLPGKMATQHQVYFSSNLAEVENGAAAADKGKLTETKLAAGVLRSSTTYYWRVDEIKADGSVEKGPIWSFTTADGVAKKVVRQWWSNIPGTALSALTGNASYPDNPTGSELLDVFEGPTDVADNYGSRLYGWLKIAETADYTFWMASDDFGELRLSTDADPANAKVIASVPGWTNSRQWDKYPAQKSAAIKLEAGKKYYIEVLMKEGGGGDNVAVSWQGGKIATQTIIGAEYVDTFALPPLQAFSPSPANGAVDAPQDGALSWSAGEKAQKHEVYLGDDKAAIAAADTTSSLFQGSQSGTSFNAGDFEWGKTYYWRVDETNPAEADSPWKGTVWSFTTANFIAIDDMESYTDDEGNRIYETWIDGWTNNTGSTVGNLVAPFAERTIVRGGKQSMPMDYNNTKTPFYSEAEQTFAPLQNWTVHGVTDLSLWVRGRPVSFVDQGDGAFTVSASGNDIWNNADNFRFVYKRLNGDGSITVQAESLVNTDAWAKAGVMIRESLDPGSTFAYMIQSFSSGASFGWRQVANAGCGSRTQAGIRAPQWVKLVRKGNDFTAQYSTDGKTWTDIKNADGTVTTTTVNMPASVYIGLAVTSHNVNATTTAEFSGMATTGGVTGAWQATWIGVNADLTNGAANLYVAVEDSAGKVAVASDPALAHVNAWTEWKIPLSSLTGVNLARVKKLYVGVGDKKTPVPGGSGRVYLDDIRVTKP